MALRDRFRAASRDGALTEGRFRRLLAAATATSFGGQVAILAIPTLAIFETNAGPLAVGLLYAVGYAAAPLVGVPAGVLADRLRHRHIMVAASLVRAAALGSVPAAWAAWNLSLVHLFLVAALVGVASALHDVTAQAALPAIVGRARLTDANAKLALARSAAHISGPPAAGASIQLIGAPATFLLDAAAHLVAATTVTTIEDWQPEGHRHKSTFVADLVDGLRFVWKQVDLRRVAAAAAILNLGGGIVDALFLIFVYRTLGLDAAVVGAIYAIGTAGTIAGSLLAPRVVRRLGTMFAIRTSLMLAALALWLIPMAKWGVAAAVLILYETVFALAAITFAITQLSWRQEITPDEYQGRTHATIRSLSLATLPIGAAAGGVLGHALGILSAIVVGAAIATGGALWFIATFGRDRSSRSPDVAAPTFHLRQPAAPDSAKGS